MGGPDGLSTRANESVARWQRMLQALPASDPSQKLIVGLNYSGMHDTSVALVAPTGKVLLAAALERFSRIKQDGRPPDTLLAGLRWDDVDAVAVSTDKEAWAPDHPESLVHPHSLPTPRMGVAGHGQAFYAFLDTLPVRKQFVCHQLSHAASAFWLSGLDEAICLTYDGGMWNSPWFGGLYRASRTDGIVPLDRFAGSHYAKITSLYSIVTAILGFSPNKHEGKITGLAAYGQPTERCRRLLDQLFGADYFDMEAMVDWAGVYGTDAPAVLAVNTSTRDRLAARFKNINRAEIAATLQHMTEDHVLEILSRARQRGWASENICLAGGLFANVALNRRIANSGYRHVFVAPPMTDDGTAVGAALAVASSHAAFSPGALSSVFWGPDFSSEEVERALNEHGLTYQRRSDGAAFIADRLSRGDVVAVFEGRMEFGPRALGHRSILSQATDPDVNTTLNARLRRTEFMPFAPVTRAEDAGTSYQGLSGLEHTAEFMTVTCACTEMTTREAPAVVHVDGTARPQLVRRERHPLLHGILTAYRERTGISSLINTSFNVHEEPIVCSPEDAIRGFLEAGLDLLYLEGGYVVSIEENATVALNHLRAQLAVPSFKELQLATVNAHLFQQLERRLRELKEKQEWAESLLELIDQRSGQARTDG